MSYKHLFAFVLLLANACEKNPADPSTQGSTTSTVVGSVTDKYHYPMRPIPNATLLLSSQSGVDSTLSDSTGRFHFHQVLKGPHVLRTWAAHCDTVSITFATNGEDTVTRDAELSLIYPFDPGIVVAGFTDSTEVDSVVQRCASLGLTVETLYGFICESRLAPDSLAYVRSVLTSKTYLDETDYTIYVSNGVIRIVGQFVTIGVADLDDWRATRAQLQISSIPSPYRNGVIRTQEGQEIYWVRALRTYSMIRWLELSYRIPIILWDADHASADGCCRRGYSHLPRPVMFGGGVPPTR